MNASSLDQEFPLVNSAYSHYDHNRQTFNTNQNQTNTSNFDSSEKPSGSLYERASLKNLTNEDLEKLIQMKNQNIDKLQTSNFYLNPGVGPAAGARANSGIKPVNTNVTHILGKYNLTAGNDDRTNQSDIFSNLDSGSRLPLGRIPVGYDSQSQKRGSKSVSRPYDAEQSSFNEKLNAVESSHLSNLQSNGHRAETSYRQNAIKDNESLLYNPEYQTQRDDQVSYAYESSPLRLSDSSRPHNKENRPTSRVLLTPKQNGPPKPMRNDGGSPAIAGAMKALQDKLTKAEMEVEELRRKVGDVATEKQRELEDQKRRMYKEFDEAQLREVELKKAVESLNRQNFELENELARLRMSSQTTDEQIQTYRVETSKLREENKKLQQEYTVISKEVKLVENEKNFHLEQNANDRDTFEEKIEDLTARLDEEKERADQLEKQRDEFENLKNELEAELRRVTNESRQVEKVNKEKIKSLEKKLEESFKENQDYFEEFTRTKEKYEKEKSSLQKKVDGFDRRVEAIVVSYDEKLEAFREENKDLKHSFNSQQTEFASLKKRVGQLEKDNNRLETDKKEKEQVIRQLMEMNDDLIRRMKKDPTNVALQNIISKKKKIEQDLQNKRNEQSTAKKGNNSNRKKTISRSRSPSVNRSAKKERLSVEDLNLTHDESGPQTTKSASKNKKGNTSLLNKQVSPLKNSKFISPKKAPLDNKSTRKDKVVETSKPEKSTTSRNAFKSLIGAYSSEEGGSYRYESLKTYTTPGTTDVVSGRRGISNVSKDYDIDKKSVTEASGMQSGNVMKLSANIEKMSSNEISTEIVKIEREITELKREYKHLLSKAQNHSTDDIEFVKSRLNQVADELQEKSEIYLLVRKKQRELLTRNL